MRKIFRLAIIIILPVLFFVFCTLCIPAEETNDNILNDNLTDFLITIMCAYFVYVGYMLIYAVIAVFTGEYTAKLTMIIALAVKLCFTLLYCGIELVALLGVFASVWAIGVWAICLIIFIVAYCFSCSLSAIYVLKMTREKVAPKWLLILLGIASFIVGLDVIAAIVYLVFAIKKEKAQKTLAVSAAAPVDKEEKRKLEKMQSLFFWRMFFISLLPYLYITLVGAGITADDSIFCIVFFAVYFVYVLYASVRSVMSVFSGKARVQDVTAVTFTAKFLTPLFFVIAILELASGTLDLDLSKFGLELPVLILCGTVTGLVSVGCVRRLKRDGTLSRGGCTALAILSFLPPADIIVALIILIKSFKTPKTAVANIPTEPTEPPSLLPDISVTKEQ